MSPFLNNNFSLFFFRFLIYPYSAQNFNYIGSVFKRKHEYTSD